MTEKKNHLPYIVGRVLELYYLQDSSVRKLELLFAVYAQIFRYVGCILLSEYMECSQANHKINAEISKLIRPSLGNWLGFIRTYIKNKTVNSGFLWELPQIFEVLSKSSFLVVEKDFRSSSRQNRDAANAILELRNMIAHGTIPPDENEAKLLIELYAPCLEYVVESFSPVFENYRVGKFINIELDFFGDKAVFEVMDTLGNNSMVRVEVDGDAVLSEGELYLLSSDEKILPLAGFFSDIFQIDKAKEVEQYFIYDGMLNKSIVYIGTEYKSYLEKYLDAIRTKFLQKEIEMKWRKEVFSLAGFFEYINDLTNLAVSLHIRTGKYVPRVYIERNCDIVINDFLKSNKTTLVVKSDAGVGKTSFLCHTVMKYMTDNIGIYLINGSSLKDNTVNSPIFEKIKSECFDERAFKSLYDFFSIMDEHIKNNERFVLVVDAVNESYNMIKVLEEIDNLTNFGLKFPWLKIIISIRTISYEILRDKIEDKFGKKCPLFSEPSLYYNISENGKPKRELELKELNISEEISAFNKYKAQNERYDKVVFSSIGKNLRALLKNPLNMNLFFNVMDVETCMDIGTENDLFEIYHNNLIEKELTRTPENLLKAIIERIFLSKKNYTDLDWTFSVSEKLIKERNSTDSIFILSPFERLKDIGLIYEKMDSSGFKVYFVYQKYLEYLLYQYIKGQFKDSRDYISIYFETSKWSELQEAHVAVMNIILEHQNKLQIIERIISYCRESNIGLEPYKNTIKRLFCEMVRLPNLEKEDLVSIINIASINELESILMDTIEQLYYEGSIKEVKVLLDFINSEIELKKVNDRLRSYFFKGLIFQHICEMDNAIEMFSKCLEKDNKDYYGKCIIQISKCYRKNGDLIKAKEIIEEYINKNSQNETIELAEALTQRGLCFFAEGRDEEALKYYYKADRIAEAFNDKYFRIYNLLGITTVLERINRIEEAKKMLFDIYFEADMLGYQDLFIDSMNGLSRKYLIQGDFDEALRWAKEGLTLWEYTDDFIGQLVMHCHIISAMVYKKEARSLINPYLERGKQLAERVKENFILDMFEKALLLVENTDTEES